MPVWLAVRYIISNSDISNKGVARVIKYIVGDTTLFTNCYKVHLAGLFTYSGRRHDLTEILLKVTLNTITLSLSLSLSLKLFDFIVFDYESSLWGKVWRYQRGNQKP